MTRSQVVEQLRQRLGPVTLSRDQLVDVPDPLLPLFPFGGLQRGSLVGFGGAGSWSVAMAMTAAATGRNGWAAIVGIESLGLVAAAELGVDLNRLLVIESPGAHRLAAVIATLLESVEVILVQPSRPIGTQAGRRIKAKAKEKGRVVFDLEGAHHWPHAPDLVLTGKAEQWQGIGDGHGYLHLRQVHLNAQGRRSASQARSLSILLPGPTRALEPAPTPASASDSDSGSDSGSVAASEDTPVPLPAAGARLRVV